MGMTIEELDELLNNAEVKNPLAIIKELRELPPREYEGEMEINSVFWRKEHFTVDELSEIRDLHNKDYLLEENDGCRD